MDKTVQLVFEVDIPEHVTTHEVEKWLMQALFNVPNPVIDMVDVDGEYIGRLSLEASYDSSN